MPRLLTPKFLLRGFEFSVLASMVGFGITLLYGNDLSAFLAGIGRIHWGWLRGRAGAGLAWTGSAGACGSGFAPGMCFPSLRSKG